MNFYYGRKVLFGKQPRKNWLFSKIPDAQNNSSNFREKKAQDEQNYPTNVSIDFTVISRYFLYWLNCPIFGNPGGFFSVECRHPASPDQRSKQLFCVMQFSPLNQLIPFRRMHNSPSKPPSILSRLLSSSDNVSELLIDLLEKAQLLVLLRLSGEMRETLLKNPRAINKIYYETCLRSDKSMLFSFYCDANVQKYEREQLSAIYEHERLDWSDQLKKYNKTMDELNALLVQIVPDDAEAIVRDLARTLREPDLPLPRLRHQTVGTYCNSPFQMLLAELNWSGKPQADDWQPEIYLPLKKKIIELAQPLKQQIESLDPVTLKTLRYRPETLPTYQPTRSLLLNLLQLILQLVSVHLDGLSTYFSCLSGASQVRLYESISTNCSSIHTQKLFSVIFSPQHPFDFLTQLVVRYRLFRNSIFDLEQKVGFLFQHFGLLFECLYQEYSLHPSCHLWRFMEKMWVSRMRKYHGVTNMVYAEMFLRQVEECMKRMVDLHQTDCEEEEEEGEVVVGKEEDISNIFNNKVQLLYLKQNKPLSCRYAERKFGRTHPKSVYIQSDPDCQNQIFSEYTQYLVDQSINEYNVHWCGSTGQRLGLQYRNAEKEILRVAEEHFRETQEMFDNLAVTKTIFEKTAHFLTDKIKPPTLFKIIKTQLQFLGNARIERLKVLDKNCGEDFDGPELTILKQWKLKLPDLSKQDQTVQYFNQQRQISQDTGQIYSVFFDLDKEVSLQMLQKHAKDCSQLDSQPQMQYLESYVSNDSTDLHQLQEPPRVNLSRINSMM